MSITGVPSARRYHGMVWTGRQAIVWGGESPVGGGAVDTGARYTP